MYWCLLLDGQVCSIEFFNSVIVVFISKIPIWLFFIFSLLFPFYSYPFPDFMFVLTFNSLSIQHWSFLILRQFIFLYFLEGCFLEILPVPLNMPYFSVSLYLGVWGTDFCYIKNQPPLTDFVIWFWRGLSPPSPPRYSRDLSRLFWWCVPSCVCNLLIEEVYQFLLRVGKGCCILSGAVVGHSTGAPSGVCRYYCRLCSSFSNLQIGAPFLSVIEFKQNTKWLLW